MCTFNFGKLLKNTAVNDRINTKAQSAFDRALEQEFTNGTTGLTRLEVELVNQEGFPTTNSDVEGIIPGLMTSAANKADAELNLSIETLTAGPLTTEVAEDLKRLNGALTKMSNVNASLDPYRGIKKILNESQNCEPRIRLSQFFFSNYFVILTGIFVPFTLAKTSCPIFASPMWVRPEVSI